MATPQLSHALFVAGAVDEVRVHVELVGAVGREHLQAVALAQHGELAIALTVRRGVA